MEPDPIQLAQQLKADSAAARAAAAERLCRLGGEAQPAAVALVEACGDDCEDVIEWSAAALEELGPPPFEHIDALARLTTASQPDVSYWAITLLGRLGPRAAPAVSALTTAFEQNTNTASRQRAAWALGQIGPPAAPARAALAAAAQSADARLARLASAALENIPDLPQN